SRMEEPLGVRQAVAEDGEMVGAQKAAVLNHSEVVGSARETGAPEPLARRDRLTPREMPKVLPRRRGGKYRPAAMVKWAPGGEPYVEASAFGAAIADIHHDASGKLTLDVEVPDLDVAEAVVGIGGETIGDRGGGGGKAILQGKNVGRGTDIGRSDRKGRLEG